MSTETLTQDGARAIARLLAGTPTPAVALDGLDSRAGAIARAIAAAAAGDRLAVFEESVAGLPDADRITRQVFAIDPASPPAAARSAEVADTAPPYPPLPTHLRPQVDTGGAGRWLDTYVEYATLRSPMTPRLFHESAGLWLASTAVARRLMLGMPHAMVYPNLWMLWLAPTTIFHKSTGMAIAEELVHDQFPHLLLPGQTTPEALFTELAGREPYQFEQLTEDEQALWQSERNFAGQRSLLLDEASGLLNEASRDYNAGLLEHLLKLYDCARSMKRQTQKQGRLTVQNAYLSLLAASTPAAMREHLRAGKLWTDGWWSRCLILMPEARWPEYRRAPVGVPVPHELQRGLARLYGRLPRPTWPDPATPVHATLAPQVEECWLAYHQAVGHEMLRGMDERLFGSYGRLPTHALKVALLLAALDWPEKQAAPRVELAHLARAIDIAEGWRASLHRALAESTRTEADGLRQRILDNLDVAGETCRDLARLLNRRATEVQKHLDALVEEGEVERLRQDSGDRGGRPTWRYRGKQG